MYQTHFNFPSGSIRLAPLTSLRLTLLPVNVLSELPMGSLLNSKTSQAWLFRAHTATAIGRPHRHCCRACHPALLHQRTPSDSLTRNPCAWCRHEGLLESCFMYNVCTPMLQYVQCMYIKCTNLKCSSMYCVCSLHVQYMHSMC
jgi:hypothetical protein